MSGFVYTARDESGQSMSGSIEAATLAEASKLLRAQGKYPVSVRPAPADASSGAQSSAAGGVRLPRQAVVTLSMQLSVMIETGVTLTEALDCIAAQADEPRLKKVAEDLSTQVQSGTDFSTALARHPRSFPRLYVALVKASERSGMMSKMLTRAAAYLRDEQDTIRRVRGALIYPAVMLSFAVLTTIFLLAFVLPRFTAIYASKGAMLPAPTRLLMAASALVTGHWPALLVGLAVLLSGGWIFLESRPGRRLWHSVQLHMPLLGPMYRKLHLARGIRMIGTMAGAGVNLIDCVTVANDLCANSYFRELWDDVLHKIQAGKQMSDPLSQSPLVPRSVAQMIHSGEKSGRLASVMEQVAGFSDQELKEKIAEVTRYIEPAMIVLMGVLIGGVAMALMLPIFTIGRVVGH